MGRPENVRVFEDTQRLYETHLRLREAVSNSLEQQKLISERMKYSCRSGKRRYEDGAEVLILGAFGCGAFRNPPEVVAQAMKTVVDEYRYCFKTIEMAAYCTPRDDTNYRVFSEVFHRQWPKCVQK